MPTNWPFPYLLAKPAVLFSGAVAPRPAAPPRPPDAPPRPPDAPPRSPNPPPRPATVPTFRELFEGHAPYVWRALRGLGVAERDVDDVCQEVFVAVHRKLPEFEPRANPRTWLYAFCLRAASDYRRRAFVRREQMTDTPPDLSAPADQHERAERTWARDVLDRALERLDDEKRDVFVLYEIEGLSIAEAAEAVGVPLKTAYSRLAAARREVVDLVKRWQAIGGAP